MSVCDNGLVAAFFVSTFSCDHVAQVCQVKKKKLRLVKKKKKRFSDFTFTHAVQWNFLRRLVCHSILTAESVDSKAAHFISTSHAGEPSTGIRLPSIAGDGVGISSRQKRKRQTGAVLQKWHLRHTSSFPMLFESLKSNNFHHSLIIPNI